MALKGSAFLALWNDIEPRRDAEYNLWHTREHVPERVTVPGILSGRRYVAEAAPHRYFTLYELQSPGVLASPSYTSLVDNPTPWSRSMRPGFRNFLRYPCATLASIGRGLGGAIITMRFSLADAAAPLEAEDAAALCRSLVAANADLTGAHLGAADPAVSFTIGPSATQEAKRAGYVLLIEAHDAGALARAVDALGEAPRRLGAAGPLQINTYRLNFAITDADLGAPATPVTRPS